MSHNLDVPDATRARELYKYYQPAPAAELTSPAQSPVNAPPPAEEETSEEVHVQSNVTSKISSSPDSALTAFAQLVAWRIGVQRAIISLVDGDTQYYIAESTRSLDLLDCSKHNPGDGLWVGCSKISTAGMLCERTIAMAPAPFGEYAAFVVSDMSKDDCFNQLSFVSGPPHFKFYAGTPLITKRGIAIGSLFVIDESPRKALSKSETHFMGTMAATIMRHLEMLREVEEHRRGMKMSRGLASFVEGRSQLVEAEIGESEEGSTIVGQFEATDGMSNVNIGSPRPSRPSSQSDSAGSIERKEVEYSSAILKVEETIMQSLQRGKPAIPVDESHETSEIRPASMSDTSMKLPSSQIDIPSSKAASPGSTEESEAFVLKNLFSRAANLIREAFEVDGGSVFYDTQKGFSNEYGREHSARGPTTAEDQSSEDSRSNSESRRSESPDFTSEHSHEHLASQPSTSGMFHRPSNISNKNVELLGFSTPSAASVNGDAYPGPHSFLPFDEETLHGFLRRYARGKLWTFDEGGCISSSEEDIKVPLETQGTRGGQTKKKRSRALAEATVLLKHFPGVRQLLFVPLWDASRSRWLSGNFTWSTEPTRILSKQSELAFLTAFGNSVMAECSRLDTEIADRKKADFIGSISHELRSPLHGILASAEFLGEEVNGAFAKGLVETIDSCGRTLLDTINHILDFSKINHLEKNWRRNRRASAGLSRPAARTAHSLALRKTDLPMINLFANIDISIVCEEVVEGVFAGHVFQNVTASSFDMVPDSRGKMSDSRQYISSSDTTAESDLSSHHSNVAVILDIDVENYHFTTQPGAFRRVIMNLLGNALKYTSRGYVKVKLDTVDLEDLQPAGSSESIPRACVTLTVTDTGKGISSDFIRSKLFTPFAQENSLSSGTGLGLSIVRSIVALLEGEIAIQSELGQGTEVKVTLPLLRELPKGDSSGSTPKSVSSVPKESEQVVDHLRARVAGKTVTLYGFSSKAKDSLELKADEMFKASVTNFLTDWYELRLVSGREKADIVVANEPNDADIANLTRLHRKDKRRPAVLALCSHSARFEYASSSRDLNANIGFLAKPIGPLKLARALSQCLDGIPVTSTPVVERAPPSGSGPESGPADLTNVFEDLSLSSSGREILDNSRMAADSENARKAIESPMPTPNSEIHEEFPFPLATERPHVSTARSMPSDKENLTGSFPRSAVRASGMLSTMEKGASTLAMEAPTSVRSPQTALHPPSLLLVDDNKINLRLLRTYMVRRRYPCIDEAENGVEAVNAFQNREDGYDIIFMDISMPVLDGFGATRQIRQIEQARKDKAAREGKAEPSPALVIAFTGLASSRDQSEAFMSGIDLFLTKPVSFKEVGTMLDNWEANRDRDVKPIMAGSGFTNLSTTEGSGLS